jgi:[ribosomal protein S18]-alanine N-acetyltransferase
LPSDAPAGPRLRHVGRALRGRGLGDRMLARRDRGDGARQAERLCRCWRRCWPRPAPAGATSRARRGHRAGQLHRHPARRGRGARPRAGLGIPAIGVDRFAALGARRRRTSPVVPDARRAHGLDGRPGRRPLVDPAAPADRARRVAAAGGEFPPRAGDAPPTFPLAVADRAGSPRRGAGSRAAAAPRAALPAPGRCRAAGGPVRRPSRLTRVSAARTAGRAARRAFEPAAPWTAAEFASLLRDPPRALLLTAPQGLRAGARRRGRGRAADPRHRRRRAAGASAAAAARGFWPAAPAARRRAATWRSPPTTPARALYAACGFAEAGRRRGYYARETARVMRWCSPRSACG